MNTRLIGLIDAARELGVSVFTLRRLAASSELKTVTVGARRLVPVSEVERIAAAGAGKPRNRRNAPRTRVPTTSKEGRRQ